MLNINRKFLATASAAAAIALLTVGCVEENTGTPAGTDMFKGKVTIDGGETYPVINNQTGPYYVNPQVKADAPKIYNGRVPTANEIKVWNKDVMPDGTGLPEGSGSVEEGEELYDAKCVMCHGDFGSGGGGYPALSKGNAYEMQKTLTNNRWHDPEADGPKRVFGSYWPKVSTLYWYIKDGMPHPFSKSLSVDETYALTAYILNINEMLIDGQEVDDEYVLNRAKLLKVKMPNVDGFIPKIDGPNGRDNVRAFYSNPANFGAIKVAPGKTPCMENCQADTVVITRIQNGGIKDFLPPMSDVRDLPKEKEVKVDPVKVYQDTCAMCHSSYLSPGSAEWSGYLSKGMDKVYANAIHGTEGGMPAKGGASISDSNFKTVVDYITTGKVK
jgi:cytochrome c